MSYLDDLSRVISDVVGPAANEVDRDGRFPRRAIDALGDAGLLGLVSAASVGGGGQGMREAAEVIERLSEACGSTAMIVLMHYAATAIVEAHGSEKARAAIASGQHLSTLAFSEAGSRSHFWVPMSTAREDDGQVRLDARKSWVTSAGEADSYVWSSRPVSASAAMTLWLVPSDRPGLSRPAGFDGFGLRGNASTPVTADGVIVARDEMLGEDGAGLDIALTAGLPWFLVLSAAFSLGLMEAVVAETTRHVGSTRLEHLGQALAEQPLVRADLGRMHLETAGVRAQLADTLGAVESGREDATLRVLGIKAAAAEAAGEVTDLAMKLCGGAAFRKEVGIERRFRDGRAARVMAPTTDTLLDFIGRAVSGQPLLEA
jgi:alkylation response protein AidB-like acyl-CoA dehydrogenase